MKSVLCFAALFQSFLFADSSPELHALIIAETREESQIALGVEKDIEHVTKSLQTISKKIKYPLKLTVLQDSTFTTDALHDWLESLPQASSDITFVYYSGHGVANHRHKPWPAIALSDGIVSGSLVVEHLKKNRHRLDIILFDSCNSKADVDIWQSFKAQDFVLSYEKKMPGLKTLFLNTNALIVGAAAKRGEESGITLSGHRAGSFFTNAFFLALKKCSQKSSASWQHVFTETYKTALKFSHGSQHLIYKIE